MKILVTRPEPDAARLGERLRALGHDPVVEPLMSADYIDPATGPSGTVTNVLEEAFKDVQAIAFTSANGVRALARCYTGRHLPVFAVGEATAAAARQEGFDPVHVAAGDVDHLAADITARLDPKAGSIAHLAGTAVAGDLQGDRAARGVQVDRHVLYTMTASASLSQDVIAQITEASLDAVLIFSPRTGRILADLIVKAGLQDASKAMTCYCLSANVAAAVAKLSFANCLVAATPDEDALMALLPKG